MHRFPVRHFILPLTLLFILLLLALPLFFLIISIFVLLAGYWALKIWAVSRSLSRDTDMVFENGQWMVHGESFSFMWSKAQFPFFIASILLASLFFYFILSFTSPTLFYKDAGEIAASSFLLGVPHPTGFPLLMIFGKAFSLVPVGEFFFRMNLVSSISSAAGYLFLILCIPLLFHGMREGMETSKSSIFSASFFSAVAAGILLLSSETFMTHAVSSEVYALNFLVVGILLFLFLSSTIFENSRLEMLFFFFYGLTPGIHAASLLTGSILAIFMLARMSRNGRLSLKSLLLRAIFFVVGCCAIIYLPAAAMRQPLRNWGDPSDIQSLIRHLTAGRIRESFAGEIGFAGLSAFYWNMIFFARTLLEGIYPVLPVTFAGTLYLMRAKKIVFFAVILLLVADALFSILVNPMGISDLQTGIISNFVIALFTAAGTYFIYTKAEGMGWIARVALKVTPFLLLYLPASETIGKNDRSGNYLPVELGEQALGAPDNGSLLLTSSDDLSSLVMGLQIVAGERPDILHIVKQHVNDVHHIRNLIRHYGRERFGADFIEEFETDEDILPAGRIVPLLEKLIANYNDNKIGFELGEGFDRVFFSGLSPDFPVFVYKSKSDGTIESLPEIMTNRALLDSYVAKTDKWGKFYLSEYFRHSGTYLEITGRTEAAEASLRTSITLNPGNYRALNNLGVILISRGKRAEGIAMIKEAVDIMPLYSKGRKNLEKYSEQIETPN